VQGKRKFQTLKDFIDNLHKEGTGLLNYNGNNVPCIYVDLKRYESIISRTYGKKLAVDTLLNIFHDGTHVFVDIEMKFLDLNIEEYFLVFANDMMEFFEALSKTGLMAIVPQSEYYGNQNIFIIQIPKIESAKQAFEIIKSKTKK
jgi:hypothetical protein